MKFSNPLFYLILLEISLGGGGRLTSLGDVSLRIVLFVLSMSIAFLSLNRVRNYHLNLAFLFSGILVFSSFLGILNKAKIELVLEDVKILCYFIIILFFSLKIRTAKDLDGVIDIIKISSVGLSAAYILAEILILSGYLDGSMLYEITFDSGEFVFRNDYAFVYKGFLFSSIGLFFFLFDDKSKSKYKYFVRILCSILVVVSIFMTYTRGLVISLAGSAFLGYLLFLVGSKKVVKSFFFAAFGVIVAFLLTDALASAISDVRASNQGESDIIRLETIEEVFSMLSPLSIFIGHGFGVGVPTRPIHMEISYLEIFHKQGFLGLSFYFFILVKIVRDFLRVIRSEFCSNVLKMHSTAFISSTIFVYLQSGTNPLLTNPIGISIIILSMLALNAFVDPIRRLHPSQMTLTERT